MAFDSSYSRDLHEQKLQVRNGSTTAPKAGDNWSMVVH